MDGKTEQFVINTLKLNADRFAVLMVTHRRHLAGISDRIYSLENGFANS
jgi:ABC-type transport system involved in cytochrome bd biosynthesis fused ATPase/permease subunit